MSPPNWEIAAAQKRASVKDKIPVEWRLPDSILSKYANPDCGLSVHDVPKTCGILTEKELELTEKYDATALLAKLAAGEVR
jgi:amidase